MTTDPDWLEINGRIKIVKEYPWMAIAQRELGVAEVPGSGDNPRIVEYLKSTSLGKPDNQNDETPWCSAFVNWCMEQAGLQGTNSAWARSWLKWGKEPPEGDYIGCVAILKRGENSGHVGFLTDYYVGGDDEDGWVELLGGNQGDKVCHARFPMTRVLDYRVPKGV